MTVVAEARALVTQGRVALAFDMLSQAVEKGDDRAAAELADWRMRGSVIRRDLPESRRLYELAARSGNAEALDAHIALMAIGAGGTGRDWPRAVETLRDSAHPRHIEQCALLAGMSIDALGNPAAPVSAEIRHRSPYVATISAFLTSPECDYLSQLARPLLKPSQVFDPATRTSFQHPERTASAAVFPFVRENPVLHAINRRIAAATGTTYEQGEPLQVLSYSAGEQYRLHIDSDPREVNPRLYTLLVYLNDGYEGGETQFPHIDWSFKGRTGDAIIFRSLREDGQIERRSAHAGLPVTAGTKLILSKWIRQRPLDLSGPPGRPF